MSNKVAKKSSKDNSLPKMIVIGIIATVTIFIFSIFMAIIASSRNSIADRNYRETVSLYNGEIKQSAPKLNSFDVKDDFIVNNDINKYYDQVVLSKKLKEFAKETNIINTNVKVNLDADFVKKGLEFQPSFKTHFEAEYNLKNSLEEKSVVKFEFPFPFNIASSEISNVNLIVNGKEIENAKGMVQTDQEVYDSKLKSYVPKKIDGLIWEGEVEALDEVNVKVSYDTVGISKVFYEGYENNLGSQDFYMKLNINGTRRYNVNSGLIVSEREFGDNSVTLIWDKKNLLNAPKVNINIADKLAPSTQVSRIYLAMAPIYAVFIGVLIWASFKFGKKLRIKDMLIITVLYILYFPLLHYLASFSIDPTIEAFAFIPDVSYFSMPLYAAFVIDLVLIGGLMIYLISSVYGRKQVLKSTLPSVLMFLGFFPLVITIPEYTMLLVLIGLVILIALFIQSRLSEI